MTWLKNFLTRTGNPVWQDLVALFIPFGISSYLLLGRIPLLEPDEGRYAEIPREMLERGDFITPTLNYVKYFEKPPLHYWLNAISFSLFGQNEFAARFAGATCGLLAIVLVWFFGKKLFDRRVGIWSALVLGTSLGFVAQARINLTDMTLTFFLSAALGFFLVASREGERRKGLYYYLFYVCAALAVLAKGLIGIVLPTAIIGCFILLTGRWRLLKEMRLATGLALFLLVAAPWFIMVSLRNPEFARFFFIHEHFERYLTKVHRRYQPPWFFIPILLGVMLPWSFFIPTAVKDVWRERRSDVGQTKLFLLLWAALIFLFFSASSSKLVPYILPVVPALSILIGVVISSVIDGEPSPCLVPAKIAGGIFFILGTAAIIYPLVTRHPWVHEMDGLLLGAIAAIIGASALVGVRKRSSVLIFGSLVMTTYALTLVAPQQILPDVAKRKSVKRLATIVKEQAGPDALVVGYGYDQGLPFYAARRVIVVGGPGELEFGSKLGDQSAWFLTPSQFKDEWDGLYPVYAILHQTDLNALQKMATTPVTELGREGKNILITNRLYENDGNIPASVP